MVVDPSESNTLRVQRYAGRPVPYHSGKPPVAIRWVVVGLDRKLTGLVSNDSRLTAEQLITYFVRRWSIETTFALVRAHLGVETQRQWSELDIARTTPILMGLFSLVTLLANSLQKQGQLSSQVSSWYVKEELTFSDALAGTRRYLWQEMHFYVYHIWFGSGTRKNESTAVPAMAGRLSLGSIRLKSRLEKQKCKQVQRRNCSSAIQLRTSSFLLQSKPYVP